MLIVPYLFVQYDTCLWQDNQHVMRFLAVVHLISKLVYCVDSQYIPQLLRVYTSYVSTGFWLMEQSSQMKFFNRYLYSLAKHVIKY